jgi:mono/diheme cytochrome c family protein
MLFKIWFVFLIVFGGVLGARVVQAQEQAANPVPFTIDTIKRGRQHYTVHCVTCHGTDGRGDTEMREFLKTAPADLTDNQWMYGGHDLAVYDSIFRGRPERDMPGYADQLSEQQIWQIVGYLRYLGGQRP